MSQSTKERELAEFVKKYNFIIPDRGLTAMKGMKLQWRDGIPDYKTADLFFFKGKSRNHAPGSLEMVVENLVKKWEMEITHLLKTEECSSMSADFKIRINDGKVLGAKEFMKNGSYNTLLQGVSIELYNSESHTFESSQVLFRSAFTEGFAWEVLEVFSGPPKVALTWRHWGRFSGEYKDRKGTGEMMEMYGFLIATVNEELQLTEIEVYFRPEGLLKVLDGKRSPSENLQGKALFGACCPLHQAT